MKSSQIKWNKERSITDGLLFAVAKAAVACNKFVGKEDNIGADLVAVEGMKEVLNKLDIAIKVKIGEGERDEAPMLYSGQILGRQNLNHQFPSIDIAVDPLEGTNACSKNLPNSLSVICANGKDKIINAPDVYMDKIATGIKIPKNIIDIDNNIKDNIHNLATFLNKPVEDIVVCVLNRDRNLDIINKIKESKAKLVLIEDGDVLAILKTHKAFGSSIDLYVGVGGAPEGVLAAGFVSISNGFFQGRFCYYNDKQQNRIQEKRIDTKKVYSAEELSGPSPFFCLSFITDGFKSGPRLISRLNRTDNSENKSKIYAEEYSKVHSINVFYAYLIYLDNNKKEEKYIFDTIEIVE